MQTKPMHTIKRFMARLAGAPLAPPPISVCLRAATPTRDGSALYASPTSRPSRTQVRSQTTRQRDGDEGEALARHYLERAGLRFVAANVRYRDGELDLVMRDATEAARPESTLVFVEVRRRAGTSHGGALASVTAAKRRRVVAAAAHFLVGLGLRVLPPCRFDVVTIDGDGSAGFRIEWYRDAFRDEGRSLD